MSKETGGPAFLTENEGQSGPSTWRFEGMTLRDYFAAHQTAAIVAKYNGEISVQDICRESYEWADELLKARKQ